MNKKYHNYIFQFLITAILVIIIFSCRNSCIYDKYKPVPVKGWHKDSTIIFKVPVYDTMPDYNLIISVRNEVSYNFSNLWLFIEISVPGGRAEKDTFEIVLANPSGKWIGKGLAGLKTRDAVYRRSFNFPVQGEYTFKIRHGMRPSIIRGVRDLGFRVEKSAT